MTIRVASNRWVVIAEHFGNGKISEYDKVATSMRKFLWQKASEAPIKVINLKYENKTVFYI